MRNISFYKRYINWLTRLSIVWETVILAWSLLTDWSFSNSNGAFPFTNDVHHLREILDSMSNLQSCLVWTGKTHLCAFTIENNLGRLIWCKSIKMFLFAFEEWIQDCFCILRDVTSFISRCRFSFQLNVLYGWFYWINSTVRLETRLEKRFEENKMLHKETLNSSEYCKIPLQKSCQRRLCREKR